MLIEIGEHKSVETECVPSEEFNTEIMANLIDPFQCLVRAACQTHHVKLLEVLLGFISNISVFSRHTDIGVQLLCVGYRSQSSLREINNKECANYHNKVNSAPCKLH